MRCCVHRDLLTLFGNLLMLYFWVSLTKIVQRLLLRICCFAQTAPGSGSDSDSDSDSDSEEQLKYQEASLASSFQHKKHFLSLNQIS